MINKSSSELHQYGEFLHNYTFESVHVSDRNGVVRIVFIMWNNNSFTTRSANCIAAAPDPAWDYWCADCSTETQAN